MKWAYSMGSRFLLSSPFLLFPGSFKGRAACEGRAILSFLTMQETVQLGKDTFILQETWKAGMGGEHDDNGEIDVTEGIPDVPECSGNGKGDQVAEGFL